MIIIIFINFIIYYFFILKVIYVIPEISYNFLGYNSNLVYTFFNDSMLYYFGFTILIIGTLTQIYAVFYNKYDRNLIKLLYIISFFIISMSGLVFCNNTFIFYLFWELIGICSFLLIGFWKNRSISIIAAIKTITINK